MPCIDQVSRFILPCVGSHDDIVTVDGQVAMAKISAKGDVFSIRGGEFDLLSLGRAISLQYPSTAGVGVLVKGGPHDGILAAEGYRAAKIVTFRSIRGGELELRLPHRTPR